MKHLLLASVLLCGVCASSALAARYGEIEVTLLPQAIPEGDAQTLTFQGYLEYRVLIRNHSAKRDHQVRIIQPGNRSRMSHSHLQQNSRTILSAHGTSVVVSLFQPPIPTFDSSIAIDIDGIRQEALLPARSSRTGGYFSNTRPVLAVLAGRGIPQSWKDDVVTATSNGVLFFRSELPVSEWSSNWLGYTSYDAVVLTSAEVDTLPADVLVALQSFAQAGGTIMIYSPRGIPTEIIPERLKTANSSRNTDGTMGVGFGRIGIATDGMGWPGTNAMEWPGTLWVTRTKSDSPPGNYIIRLVHESQVPVRGMLLLVVLFALGIGPLNVWWLSRRKKKMWLWWNVPLFSMLTCLMIFTYSLLSEGVRGESRTVLLTLLDEDAHRATSLGYVSYYCPLTPSDGLHFPYDTEVIPLDENRDYNRWSGSPESGQPKTIDWTNDQHLISGWLPARVSACFAIRRNETRRERLVFHNTGDGGLKVVNGLGAELQTLHYLDENGVLYQGSDVPMGQEVQLKKVTSDVAHLPEALQQVYRQNWDFSIGDMRSTPEKYLRKGSYIAVLQGSPFMEASLKKTRQNGNFSLVYGLSAGAKHGH